MPYYCTVPRCTSMAGKAKNVSFHQFPRDEELARLWNNILKRGKPYTKYSKVCSLHFKPEDYTITSVGKNKGQWRTLRKDAIPSQNLPSESPTPYHRKQWSSWSSAPPNMMDPNVATQMAQAIYMQTMMAMQAAGTVDPTVQNGIPPIQEPHTSTDKQTYKCNQCSKCFKDPDVYILHKRTHTKTNGKENLNTNTLESNPILANLLKTNTENVFDTNVLTMENLLMTALAANMDYIRNISMIKPEPSDQEMSPDGTAENSENFADESNEQRDERSEQPDDRSEQLDERCEQRDESSEQPDERSEQLYERSEQLDDSNDRLVINDESDQRLDESSESDDESNHRTDKSKNLRDESSEHMIKKSTEQNSYNKNDSIYIFSPDPLKPNVYNFTPSGETFTPNGGNFAPDGDPFAPKHDHFAPNSNFKQKCETKNSKEIYQVNVKCSINERDRHIASNGLDRDGAITENCDNDDSLVIDESV